jgi:hypothetical protein
MDSSITVGQVLSDIIEPLCRNRNAAPFKRPVAELEELSDYADIIKCPIDLRTIKEKIKKGTHYKNGTDVLADVDLMFANCFEYNPVGEKVLVIAIALQKFFWKKREALLVSLYHLKF